MLSVTNFQRQESLVRHNTRTTAVVSTGDESAMMRRSAPKTAMTIAEHFPQSLRIGLFDGRPGDARKVALVIGEPAIVRLRAERIQRVAVPIQTLRPSRKDRAPSPEYSPCWSMATITTSYRRNQPRHFG